MAADGVLLFGADGQLGHALQDELSLLGRLIPLTLADVDISDAKALQAVIRHHAPRYIVNAAAYTAVDKAEHEPALANAINATAPGIMAAEAKALGATMVHYSTDYVFNGQSPHPYKENDATDPLSVYGRSKRDGDVQVMAHAGAFFIFRSSWVVGVHGGNFLKTMLRLAQERDSLSVVADQHGVPTSARWMAQVTREVLQRRPLGMVMRVMCSTKPHAWVGHSKSMLTISKPFLPPTTPCLHHDPPTPCLTPVWYGKNLAWLFPLGKLGWTRFWPPYGGNALERLRLICKRRCCNPTWIEYKHQYIDSY